MLATKSAGVEEEEKMGEEERQEWKMRGGEENRGYRSRTGDQMHVFA